MVASMIPARSPKKRSETQVQPKRLWRTLQCGYCRRNALLSLGFRSFSEKATITSARPVSTRSAVTACRS